MICTNFPSAYESVEDGVNGYILDMNLSDLDINKLINKIPKNFKYESKCKISDWTKFLNKRTSRKSEETVYKIEALEEYNDNKPQFILNKNEVNEPIAIEKGDVYFILDKERALEIKNSGLANVEEVDINDV